MTTPPRGGQWKLFRYKVKKYAQGVLEDPITYDLENCHKGDADSQEGQETNKEELDNGED